MSLKDRVNAAKQAEATAEVEAAIARVYQQCEAKVLDEPTAGSWTFNIMPPSDEVMEAVKARLESDGFAFAYYRSGRSNTRVEITERS